MIWPAITAALAATLALYAVIAVAWTVCRWVWRGIWRGCVGAWRLRRTLRGRAASRRLLDPHTVA